MPLDRDTLFDWFSIYLKGVAMGAADTIPGVSGGTIAFITGIYERLVAAIAGVDHRLLLRLPEVRTSAGRRALLAEIRTLDLAFLVVLGSGIVTAVVTLSGVVAFGLDAYRAPMNGFFFGLIGASSVVLYREVSLAGPRRLLAAVAGFVTAFVVTGVTAGGDLPHGLPVLFAAGTVTSSAMLLPGISGAALLYILGQYEFMIGALHRFIAVLGDSPDGDVGSAGVPIVAFLAGVGIGLVTVAHAVRWALDRYRELTLIVLVSLMVGSLRLPATVIATNVDAWSIGTALPIGIAGFVGAAAVLLLDRYTDDLEYV